MVPVLQDMRNNPGKTMIIYDLPSIKDFWSRTTIPTNITNGFKISRIVPYNANIFADINFTKKARIIQVKNKPKSYQLN